MLLPDIDILRDQGTLCARIVGIMQTNLNELDWSTLLKQIRHHPDPKVRQDATREATARIWDGPEQPAERVDPVVFEPDW